MSLQAFDFKDVRDFIKEDTLTLPIKIKLSKPVKYTETEVIEDITFNREPTAGDVGSLPTTGMRMEDFYKPLSKMTGESLVLINKLSFKDVQRLIEVFNYFLEGSPEGGE